MGAFAAVGVHDDLASGQSGVPVGSANHKIPGRVDMVFHGFVEEAGNARWQLLLDTGDEVTLNIVSNLGLHGLLVCFDSTGVATGVHERIVLGRNHDGIDGFGFVLVGIANGDLAFGIGAEIFHHAALFADGRKFS